jgi:hypothetical protein
MGMYIYTNNKINYLNDYYLFYINPFFFDIIKKEGIYFFLGVNLRLESPILNIKLRKNFFKENIYYYNIGSIFNDNLNLITIGLNIKNLINFFRGKIKININIMKNIKQFLNKNYNNINNINNLLNIFIGNNIIFQKDNKNIYNYIKTKLYNLNLFLYNKNYNNNNIYILLNNINMKFYYKKILNKQNIGLNIHIIYNNLFNILYNELNINNINNINNIDNIDIIYILNGN